MKYIKKPLIVEAYQTEEEKDIETLEGVMHANVGDYIITGVKGEQYPCKPDVFEETYDEYVETPKGCPPVEEERINFYIDYSAPEMCRVAEEHLSMRTAGNIFIIFGMGSVNLDISNPENWLSITRDYVEVYNAENGELTLINVNEITGFIFEPEDHVCDCGDDDCDCEE